MRFPRQEDWSGLSFPSPKKDKYYVSYSVESKKKKKGKKIRHIKTKSRKVMVKGWGLREIGRDWYKDTIQS